MHPLPKFFKAQYKLEERYQQYDKPEHLQRDRILLLKRQFKLSAWIWLFHETKVHIKYPVKIKEKNFTLNGSVQAESEHNGVKLVWSILFCPFLYKWSQRSTSTAGKAFGWKPSQAPKNGGSLVQRIVQYKTHNCFYSCWIILYIV